MLKELFYCDGTEAFFVQDAFGPNETKTRILPIEEELSARSLFFCNDTFFNKFYWNDKDFNIMINACAVVNLCWPAISRGVGCFSRSKYGGCLLACQLVRAQLMNLAFN